MADNPQPVSSANFGGGIRPQEIEVTEDNLEEMTNQVFGGEEPAPEGEQSDVAEQPEEAKPEEPAPDAAPVEQAEELPEWLKGTPYKKPEELAKGYKNLQAELTKRTEKIKPFEQFLQLSSADPKFAQYLQNAMAMYQNPELAKAYQNPVVQRPNPWNYEQSPEGQKQFDSDMEAYEQRKFNDLLNSRLSSIEQYNSDQLQRFQFQQKYQDADIQDIEQFMQSILNDPSSANKYEIAYKLKTYDQLKSQAMEEARKEVAKKMETAGKTGSPKAAANAQKTNATVENIIDYIMKYGDGAASKKFGAATVNKAIQEATNQALG